MQEQLIVNITDDSAGSKLKEFLKKLNLAYTSYNKDDSISEEEKQIVLDRLKNSKEEDDLDWEDVKKKVLKK